MSVYAQKKASEIVGLLCLASATLLILSFVSYNSLDPSLSVSSAQNSYFNYVGRLGALASDSLLLLFGLAAVFLPLPLLLTGFKKIRGKVLQHLFWKIIGFSAILLALSAGLTLLPPKIPQEVNFVPGGLLGVFVAEQMLRQLNFPGSLVVVGTLLLAGLILTTRFSPALLPEAGRRDPSRLSRLTAQLSHAMRRLFNRKPAPYRKQTQEKVITDFPAKKATLPLASEPATPPVSASSESPPTIRETAAQALEGPLKPALSEQLKESSFSPPSLDFLQEAAVATTANELELIERAKRLTAKCAEFDVRGRVIQIHPGPVVTTFEFKPDPGVKYSRITTLEDDLCLALKAESIRIDRIPGKNTVGMEVPNPDRRTIYLREILSSAVYQQAPSNLTLALGKMINGNTYTVDLAKMPHLLIAGATGSGKSVGLNCMVCSVLYKASPREVRFIMIDPKRLELGVYEGIPHLLTPIVTDPMEAANALKWAVSEMEKRYKLLAEHGVRNITQFNQLVQEQQAGLKEEEGHLSSLPYIVIIVDELADLMMTAGKDVEAALTRLAQMARAIGIHLILATQRPSVDVITGLIKANFPCRISFRVSSKIDSRTILDGNGSEQLLGQGDMLLLSPGSSRLLRLHGGYISEKEISRITRFLKDQQEPEYREEILESPAEEKDDALRAGETFADALYDEAARFVVQTGKASTSLLQRRFRIGYGRAARLLDRMENEGLIGPPDGSRPRFALVPTDYFDGREDS